MYRAMEAARGDAIQDALDQTTAPVLVVRGRHDRICPEGWAPLSRAAEGRAAELPPCRLVATWSPSLTDHSLPRYSDDDTVLYESVQLARS